MPGAATRQNMTVGKVDRREGSHLSSAFARCHTVRHPPKVFYFFFEKSLPSFAGCQGQATRQRFLLKKIRKPFTGCWPPAKKFQKKSKFFVRCLCHGTRQRISRRDRAVTVTFLCREPGAAPGKDFAGCSTKNSRQRLLGRVIFCRRLFAGFYTRQST